MYFSIQHQTRFRYDSPVCESLMELRMQPRSEGRQRCLGYMIKVNPKARVLQYRDHLGNYVHHFSVAPKHTQLLITTESTVETHEADALPATLPMSAWDELDATLAREDYWEFVMPSDFTEPTHFNDGRRMVIHFNEQPGQLYNLYLSIYPDGRGADLVKAGVKDDTVVPGFKPESSSSPRRMFSENRVDSPCATRIVTTVWLSDAVRKVRAFSHGTGEFAAMSTSE